MVELTEAALAQVAAENPTINAIVTLSPRALDDARAAQAAIDAGQAGPICGLPVGIKDVTETAGLRTTFGSPSYADHIPEADAVVVERLRQAGAVLIGKTNTPEFAAGGNTFNEVFGRTRNPHDPARSAGGSTGGGAAALASGMISLAEGTDLGGSLRIPASFCGVVGLRPSPGLIPTYPSSFLFDQLQVTGLMGRFAEDIAAGLAALSGPTPRSPVHQLSWSDPRPSDRPLSVAYCADTTGIGIDQAVERVARNAALSLREDGVTVDQIELDFSAGRQAFLAFRGLWMVIKHWRRRHLLDKFGPNVAGNIALGDAVTTAQLAEAEHARAAIWQTLTELWQRYDFLLTPTMAVPPFPVEENFPQTIDGKPMQTYIDWVAPTFVFSLTGLPVASVPAGRDPQGLPVGLQVIGPRATEAEILALCSQVQRLCPLGVR